MRKEIKYKNISWLDITRPDENDIKFLRTHFKFHPVILSEILPPSFLPQIKLFNKKYLYLVIYYPIYDKNKRETKPRELDVIITKNTLITSHYQSILPLTALWDKAVLYEDQKKMLLGRGTAFLLFFILESIAKNCLIKINRIEQRINNIGNQIFKNKEKELVHEISFVKRDILDFYRIIGPQKNVIEKISTITEEFWGEKISPYFSELTGLFSIVWNQLDTFKDTIRNLEETNNSILSTKINEVMKVLTIFSAIILPLNLLASLFGMNLRFLPFADSPMSFVFFLIIMLIMFFVMMFFFKRKNWL